MDGVIVMSSTSQVSTTGLLVFPGARVDPFAYLHPFVDIAATGTTVTVVDPLFNMALFDQRSMDELTSHSPSISQWVVAGHSLGGVKACMEADNDQVAGLLLFASYCANDVSGLDIAVVEVLAAQDGLIDTDASRQAQGNLPEGFVTLTLDEANHASFGTYGPQPGDGVSTLDRDDMRQTMNEVWDQVLSHPRGSLAQ